VELLPAPGDRRRLVLLCCILALLAVVAPIVWARGDGVRDLTGETDQGHPIKLSVNDHGKVVGVETKIDARCRGGHTWSVRWGPGRPWALFKQKGTRIRVRELTTRPAGPGRTEWILSRLVGRIYDGYAHGTVRLVARFWDGATQVQACESGLLRWAVGADADGRLAAAPPGRRLGPGYYYPSPPSLAGEMSPERQAFIEATDRTCSVTAPADDPPRTLRGSANVAQYRLFVGEHAVQLRALDRMGSPPDGVALHRHWLTYFRREGPAAAAQDAPERRGAALRARRLHRERARPDAGSALARVAAALEHAAVPARQELREVVAGDLVQVEPGLGGELGHVPEHVAELGRERGAALVAERAAVVADRLLHLLGAFAGLAAEPECRVGQIVAGVGVDGRGA
jgi:hypothetical protein